MTLARFLLFRRLFVAGALVMVMGAGASTQAAPGRIGAPGAAPGSGLIAFVGRLGSRAASADLFLLRWDGARPAVARLTEGFGRVYGLSWSPGGASLLFVAGREGEADIYALSESGRVTRVTNNQAADTAPDWGSMR
jgi:Tol biopolymer transport system component